MFVMVMKIVLMVLMNGDAYQHVHFMDYKIQIQQFTKLTVCLIAIHPTALAIFLTFSALNQGDAYPVPGYVMVYLTVMMILMNIEHHVPIPPKN